MVQRIAHGPYCSIVKIQVNFFNQPGHGSGVSERDSDGKILGSIPGAEVYSQRPRESQGKPFSVLFSTIINEI